MLVLTERVQNGYFEQEHELNGKAKVRKHQTPKLLSCQISIIPIKFTSFTLPLSFRLFSENIVSDYNSLPVGNFRTLMIESVDATDAAIMEAGFLYFRYNL